MIELLIVVAILGILAAIALPSLNQAKKRARESGAVGSIRALISAEAQFLIREGNNSRYGSLTELISGRHIDGSFTGARESYLYTVTQPGGVTTYQIKAAPQATDLRWFFAREDGRILENSVDDISTANPIPRF